MAVTYQSAGTISYNTPIFPTYPASIATGDLLILAVGVKSGVSTVTTPDTWLALGNLAGTTGTTGADVGPTRIYLFAKVYDGVETLGSSLEVIGTWNNPWAQIYRFTNATGYWDISFASGEDTAGGTTWSATMSSTMGITSGDVMLAASVDPTDVSHTYSAAGIASTGATYGSSTIIVQPRSSNGNDIGGFVFTQAVSSGSSSDAPVVTASISGTTTNVYGPTALIRIREVTEGGQPTNTASLAAVELDVANAADGQARLASVVAEVAASTDSQARLSSLLIEVMTPINKIIYPAGIGSSETFGQPAVDDGSGGGDQDVTPNSIGSAEAFGSPSLSASNEISASSIGSGEAIGSPLVETSNEVTPNGVAPGEAFGSPTFGSEGSVAPTGIASGEAFGSPTLSASSEIAATGVASSEALGTPNVSTSNQVTPTSIGSQESFGSPSLGSAASINPDSIAGAEDFGLPVASTADSVLANGIDSTESFGSPSVLATVAVALTSINSGEAFGSPEVSLVAELEVEPNGVASSEQFGQPEVTSTATVATDGVASGESIGTPSLVSAVAVTLTAIDSGEAFGSPLIESQGAGQDVTLLGIASSEAFGQLVVAFGGVTPDQAMQVVLDAVSEDPNSCTVVSLSRATVAKKATIVENVLLVGPSQ